MDPGGFGGGERPGAITQALVPVPVFHSCSLVLRLRLLLQLQKECSSPSQDASILSKSAGIPISAQVHGHLFALSPRILVAKGASVVTHTVSLLHSSELVGCGSEPLMKENIELH